MSFLGTEPSELGQEYHAVQLQFRAIAAAAVVILGIGGTFYHYVEHFGWLDSFYFCTITLATVGYGDLVPKTDAGKLFTIFYVLIGIGIIAFFVNTLVKNAALRREMHKSRRRSKLQD
jgi:voltage-gated potassium channel